MGPASWTNERAFLDWEGFTHFGCWSRLGYSPLLLQNIINVRMETGVVDTPANRLARSHHAVANNLALASLG